MADYQVLARKYRPQSFIEVLGQEAIVATLKNAIKNNRLAHAYLFCGSRGTGKTTLARIFAKALNCQNPTPQLEPCNQCSSCKEITGGHSLDVLEIDGASHRGIDDVRQINETAGYAASSGKFKIYIIDEVHMLTKEAFNALLKTLEEPPPKVKFFFATTEPHKVLPTILSRCQRFNLNRIPIETILQKLQRMTQELGVNAQEDALRMVAHRADGAFRDAESLLDQIIAFHEGSLTVETVASVLGLVPRDTMFLIDKAGKEGNYAMAFEISQQIFSQGRDIIYFVEGLAEHFRNIILVKLSGKEAPFLSLSATEREKYQASAQLYSQEQCLTLLDFLVEAQNQIRFMPSGRIALEAILLRIMRSHHRLPVDYLIRRLTELEQNLGNAPSELPPQPKPKVEQPKAIPQPPPIVEAAPTPKEPPRKEEPPKPPIVEPPKPQVNSISEDPTPTPADLGLKTAPKATNNVEVTHLGRGPAAKPPVEQRKHDTLLQFAAVELEGTIQKKQNKV